MNVFFRADANKDIGMGHVMRTLSIADAFSDVGCHVKYIVADDTVSKLINDRGYEAIVLNSDYQKMEEEKWPKIDIDILIVDSYYVTASYLSTLQRRMNRTGGKLVYIDDVYTFPYPVDILVDYNVFATTAIYEKLYVGSAVDKPQMILGPTYAPLRMMFKGVEKRNQPENVKNILISTGGADELHIALSIIRFVTNSSVRANRVYHLLLGAMNADKEEIKQIAYKEKSIVIHENVTDMRRLIESMDLAISAAGSTLYEISACGVPLITYSLADNQIPGADAFERLGLAVNIGDIRYTDDCVSRIFEAIEKLDKDYENRVAISTHMQKTVDGKGATRIVELVLRYCGI